MIQPKPQLENSKPKTVVLVGCVNTKVDHTTTAEQLYDSPLFHKSLAYAKQIHPDAIYILSAKHYLLPLNKVIAPYNKALQDMSADEVKRWADVVTNALSKKYDLQRDKFIILAGDRYRKYLLPKLGHVEIPIKGLRIGEQLSWYTKHLLKKVTDGLKRLFKFKL